MKSLGELSCPVKGLVAIVFISILPYFHLFYHIFVDEEGNVRVVKTKKGGKRIMGMLSSLK